MKRPSWFEKHGGDPPLGAGFALSALGGLYGLAARLHRRAYASGWKSQRQLGCKVISVGNLVSGGAGKTPTAAWVAAALRQRGHRVVLASRGYGGDNREAVRVVSDGRFVRSGVEGAGEESVLLAALAPGVPVLVGPRRDLVGQRAVAAFDAHILVLDDGFQHHRLMRDLDLVTVHGGGGFGNGRLLPRGPLRESPRALRNADAIGVVDGPLSSEDEALIVAHAPGAKRFVVERSVSGTRPLSGGAHETIDSMRGKEVGLLSGIARPASFRETVESIGARVIAERSFPDHHRYRERDFRDLGKEADLWLTTEKDAGKILPRWIQGASLRVVALKTEVEGSEAFLDWIEDRLRAKAAGRNVAVPPAARPPRGARDLPR